MSTVEGMEPTSETEEKDKMKTETRDAKHEETVIAIIVAVTNRYLEELKPSSVAEIAKVAGLPQSRIRKAIEIEHGSPAQLQCYQEHRTSFEHNYGSASGSHRVWVYAPCLHFLRDLLQAKGMEKVGPATVREVRS